MNNNKLKKGDLVRNALFYILQQNQITLSNVTSPNAVTHSQIVVGSSPSFYPPSLTITSGNQKTIFNSSVCFDYSKIGVLLKEQSIVYGSFQQEEVKLPLSIKYWDVWCGEKIETWRTEDIIKIGENK